MASHCQRAGIRWDLARNSLLGEAGMEFPEKLESMEVSKASLEQPGIVGSVPAHGMILKVPSHPRHSMVFHIIPMEPGSGAPSAARPGGRFNWIWDPSRSIGFSGNIPSPSTSRSSGRTNTLGRNFSGNSIPQSHLGIAESWDELLLKHPSRPPNPLEFHPKGSPCFLFPLDLRAGTTSAFPELLFQAFVFSRAFPELDVYSTPVYFSSDWLNEYWDAVAVDDYRFVYMGPKGSWTPFHADVFRSYSWSANICGRKRWLLYPAGHEEFLKDCHGNLPFDVTAPDLRDKRIYPRYSQSQPPLEIIQESGEIVFIPSGWHHQVHNLEDTISINHNWVNGCNVATMWGFLQDELAAVQREINHWKDPMDDRHLQCQLIMKSCTGIDYKEFYNFLKVIAQNRVSILEKGLDEESSSRNDSKAAISTLGMLHAVFDLKRTVKVLSSLSANEDFRKLDLTSLSPSPEALLQHLEAAIDTALL
ncbi:2-oxoglutarate and iron-dependent oxygenase JMJD4 isoform 1-T1 [Cyanocitta cristata]